MCGIFGYVGSRQVTPLLMEGLRKLEYRGYDSSGIAISNGGINVIKSIGKVSELSKLVSKDDEGSIGISHTRWATHGGVTNENAHPHLSEDGKVAIVHNGIIENSRQLRSRLEKQGIKFQSETDSEVIVHLISYYRNQGQKPITSVRNALRRARGTWGLCVIFKEEQSIICARNGSPLVIGIGDGESFIASDQHALNQHTDRAIFMEDGELAIITAGNVEMHLLQGGRAESNVTKLDEDWGDSDLSGYPHYMLKEINEQPEALRHCISGRMILNEGTCKLGGLQFTASQLKKIPHVRLLGCGTSLHACQVGRLAIEQLARVPAIAHVASEFRHNNPVIDSDALHFAVSQSGETADTLSAVKEIQLKGGDVRGIVNVVGSSIARQCGRGVYIHSGPELAVASTKAFTNMTAALLMFSIQISRTRNLTQSEGKKLLKDLSDIPKNMEKYLAKTGPINEAVNAVKDAKSVLFLGRGVSAPVAREGALKLMEVAYIPCLAYPAAEMKHGPIALLEEGSPVVVIAPNDDLKQKTISNIQECRARGAKIILIHEEGDKISDEADISIPVPKTSPLISPLLTVLPLQLIAYHTGLALGCDVDRPRNLAKSVTVE